MIEHIHPEGEPTPTLRELYERHDGSVEVVKWTEGNKKEKAKPSVFRLTEKGEALLKGIMARNAAATLARGTALEEGAARVKRIREERESNGS